MVVDSNRENRRHLELARLAFGRLKCDLVALDSPSTKAKEAGRPYASLGNWRSPLPALSFPHRR